MESRESDLRRKQRRILQTIDSKQRLSSAKGIIKIQAEISRKMSLPKKNEKRLFFAKIFRTKASEKVDKFEESLVKSCVNVKTGEMNCKTPKDSTRTIGNIDSEHFTVQYSCDFERFKTSDGYLRRRNGITEKDYFDFLRLKTKRVQQQVIDTYVYGWK